MLTGSQVVAFVMFDLVVILVAARACGALAKKVGQPGVVGEIIAGVVLGPSIFGLVVFGPDLIAPDGALGFLSCGVHTVAPAAGGPVPDATLSSCLFPPQARAGLNVLGQIALLLFMFLVGLELDFKQLVGKTKAIFIVGVSVVLVPVVLGFGVAPLLDKDIFAFSPDVSDLGFALFIGAFISITALPVLARVLQEKGLATSQMGAVAVAAAAVVTVLMFVLVSIAASLASPEVDYGALVQKLVLTVIYLAVMLAVIRPILETRLGKPYEERAKRIGLINAKQTWSGVDEFDPAGAGQALSHAMFAWILVLVFASGWIAHLLGINVVVGGFMAGLILPVRQGLARDLTTELFDTVTIVLLPVFLAFAGLTADFGQFFANFGEVIVGFVIFMIACLLGKWGTGLVTGKAAGLPWRESNLLGILMNCRGLLPLVVGLVGLQTEVISPVMNVVGVSMALITTAMTGPLFDRFNKPAPTSQPPAEVPA